MTISSEFQATGHSGLARIIVSSSLGTMLEYYDFFVYVALTGTFGTLFFPAQDPAVTGLLTAATFGIAYLARPIGTCIFGPMADRIGRKRTFVVTLLLMGAATVAMGCLPTYAAIGVAAPAMLLALRIIQGIGLGGEYGSAVVYVMEHVPQRQRATYTSLLQSTATIGLLVALAIVSALRMGLDAEVFNNWGWRVPFLLSAPIVAVATSVRLHMTETPTFLRMAKAGELLSSPLMDTLRSREAWKSILLGVFGAQGATSVSLYTSIIYMLYFLQNVLHVPPMVTNACVAVAVLVAAPCYPLFGALADWVGRAMVMLGGIVLWMVAAYPVFSGIQAGAATASWATVTTLITVLAVLTAMIMAPLPAFIAERFVGQNRTTGFGLAQQLGNILFGGFLPLISLALVNWTGNPLAGVGYSIVSLVPCLVVTLVWGLRRDRTSAAVPDRTGCGTGLTRSQLS